MDKAAIVLPFLAKGLLHTLAKHEPIIEVKSKAFRRWFRKPIEKAYCLTLDMQTELYIICYQVSMPEKSISRVNKFLNNVKINQVFFIGKEEIGGLFYSKSIAIKPTGERLWQELVLSVIHKILKRYKTEGCLTITVLSDPSDPRLEPLLMEISTICHAITLITEQFMAGEMVAAKISAETGTPVRVTDHLPEEGAMQIVLKPDEPLDIQIGNQSVTGAMVTIEKFKYLFDIEGIDTLGLAQWLKNADVLNENDRTKLTSICFSKKNSI